MEKICGFSVVRYAQYNFLDDLTPPRVNGIYYQGIGRQSWADIKYYDKSLPFHYKKLYRSLRNTSIIELTEELDIAQDLLRFSNENEQLNEMIVVYSKGLEKKIGSFTTDVKIKWLGEDIACWLGSILMEGIFSKPYLFSGFTKYINKYGLFDINSQITDIYIDHYINLNKQGYSLEIFSDSTHLLDKVWVGIPELY